MTRSPKLSYIEVTAPSRISSHDALRAYAATLMGPPPSRKPAVLQRPTSSPGVLDARRAAMETLRQRQTHEGSSDPFDQVQFGDIFSRDSTNSLTQRDVGQSPQASVDDEDEKKRKRKRHAAQVSRQLPIELAKELETRLDKAERDRNELKEKMRLLRQSVREDLLKPRYRAGIPGSYSNRLQSETNPTPFHSSVEQQQPPSRPQDTQAATSLLDFLPRTDQEPPSSFLPEQFQQRAAHPPRFRVTQHPGLPLGGQTTGPPNDPFGVPFSPSRLPADLIPSPLRGPFTDELGRQVPFRLPDVGQQESTRPSHESVEETLQEIDAAFRIDQTKSRRTR